MPKHVRHKTPEVIDAFYWDGERLTELSKFCPYMFRYNPQEKVIEFLNSKSQPWRLLAMGQWLVKEDDTYYVYDQEKFEEEFEFV